MPAGYRDQNRIAIPTAFPGHVPEREVSRQCRAIFKTFAWALDISRCNVGQWTDSRGHRVRYGTVGAPDYLGQFKSIGGRWDGRMIGVEIKRSDFDPTRLLESQRRGPSGLSRSRWQAIKHWHDQLTFLKTVNNNGGVGLWTRDAGELALALGRIVNDGVSVTIDAHGFCWLEDG